MFFIFPVIAYGLGLCGFMTILICVGTVVLYVYRKKLDREQALRNQKLEESCFYLSQMLVSFGRNHKISTALEDVTRISEGRLWCTVKKTLNKIQLGWQSERCYENAFEIPETVYGYSLMKKVHWFLIRVERQGGDCDLVLKFLKKKIQDWKMQEDTERKCLEDVRTKLNFCVLMSCLIWLFLARLSPADINIRKTMVYQGSMGLGIIALQITYGFFLRLGNQDCIRHGKEDKKTDYEKLWKTIESRKKGLSYVKAKNKLVRKTAEEFPLWMMEMLLRLQTESVAVAVRESVETAPESMRIPLKKLAEEQALDPVSSGPFNRFMEETGLPEVKSMMSGLYAIRNMGEDQIRFQILDLLEQNQNMEKTVRKLQIDEKNGRYGLLAAVPMGISVIVMMINMTQMLFLFLQYFTKGTML